MAYRFRFGPSGFIPLRQAAAQYRLSEALLSKWIEQGLLEALPSLAGEGIFMVRREGVEDICRRYSIPLPKS